MGRRISTEDILIREPKDSDWAYICSCWKQGNQKHHRWIKPHAYFNGMDRLIEKLKSVATFRVCCDPERPDFIIGWSCTTDGEAAHFVYVRPKMRLWGVATHLIKAASLSQPVVATHWTDSCVELAEGGQSIVYRPDLLPGGEVAA